MDSTKHSARTAVLQHRLRSQGLTTPALSPRGDPAGVVDRLFALQGQDLPGALWSLGLRSESTLAQVAAAFDAGTLVRSWPLRGTLHVLRGEDLPWVLALTAERTLRSATRRREELGLDPGTLENARAVASAALADGKQLGRRELLALFESAGIGTSGQRGYHLLWHLAVTGSIVLGPMRGNEQLFVLLEEWIPRRRTLDREASLAELVRRYLTGRSPATEADIAWWSKLPLTAVRTGLAAAAAEVEEVEYRGVAHWQVRNDGAEAAGRTADSAGRPDEAAAGTGTGPAGTGTGAGGKDLRTRPVVLLPGFDEYLLGYADRSAALAPEHAPLTVPGGNGVFKPTLVVDGRIAGLWSRASTAGKTVLTIHPFAPLPQRVLPGIRQAGAEYGRFLGTPVEVALP